MIKGFSIQVANLLPVYFLLFIKKILNAKKTIN